MRAYRPAKFVVVGRPHPKERECAGQYGQRRVRRLVRLQPKSEGSAPTHKDAPSMLLTLTHRAGICGRARQPAVGRSAIRGYAAQPERSKDVNLTFTPHPVVTLRRAEFGIQRPPRKGGRGFEHVPGLPTPQAACYRDQVAQ